jgi:hypothetical protein
VEVDVEAGDLEFGVGELGEFGGHFVARSGEGVPLGGAVDLGDEGGFGEKFQVFVVADAIGVEAGVGHQAGFPGFFAEAEIIEVATENVGDGNGVGADAVGPLDAAEFGEKHGEILAADVLKNAVGPDEIDGGGGDGFEGLDAIGEIDGAAFFEDVIERVAVVERWWIEAGVTQIVGEVAVELHFGGGERRGINGVSGGSAESARDDCGENGEAGAEFESDEGDIFAGKDGVFEVAAKDTHSVFGAAHAAHLEEAGTAQQLRAEGDTRQNDFCRDFELPREARAIGHVLQSSRNGWPGRIFPKSQTHAAAIDLMPMICIRTGTDFCAEVSSGAEQIAT